MDYTITYPTELSALNPEADNTDVCIRLHDGREFTIVVATPDNLKNMIAREGTGYLSPGMPLLFVERLDNTNIRNLVQELVQDEVLLQLYGSDLP